MTLSTTTHYWVPLCWLLRFNISYAECHYSESRYAEFHYAEYRYPKCQFAECLFCWMLLCWVSLSWVSLCWVSLCWMSWHPLGSIIKILASTCADFSPSLIWHSFFTVLKLLYCKPFYNCNLLHSIVSQVSTIFTQLLPTGACAIKHYGVMYKKWTYYEVSYCLCYYQSISLA
jgi:hypothetical protein